MKRKAVYYKVQPQVPLQPQTLPQKKSPSKGKEIIDSITAIPHGLFQGTLGPNLTYDQWRYQRNRRRKGLPPGQFPGRGLVNWLQRLLTKRV